MSLDEVAKKVTEKGQRESDRIIKAGGQEVLQILNKANAEAKVLMVEARKKAEKEIALMKGQEMSSAEVEGRRNLLEAEKKILEEVKKRTFEALKAAPGQKKEEVLRNLVQQAAPVIGSGFIYSNKEDMDLVKRVGSKYQFGGNIDCSGGFIVENNEKTEMLDLTYETLLEDLWNEKISEVADILFK